MFFFISILSLLFGESVAYRVVDSIPVAGSSESVPVLVILIITELDCVSNQKTMFALVYVLELTYNSYLL